VVVVVVVSVDAAQPARKIVARPRMVKAKRFIFIVRKKRIRRAMRMGFRRTAQRVVRVEATDRCGECDS
jgi:hypothetical protein